MLLLNTFHTLFWSFHCWLWKGKCRMGSCISLYCPVHPGIPVFTVKPKKVFLLWIFLCRSLPLTLSWRRPLSYRNQSIDLLYKSVDWFLYDNSLRHERVNHAFVPENFQSRWVPVNTCLLKSIKQDLAIVSKKRYLKVLSQVSCVVKNPGGNVILGVNINW